MCRHSIPTIPISLEHVFRSLTKCEQNYAPIELEISISMDVVIHSDHKPLEAILQKSLLDAPKLLQRIMRTVRRCNLKWRTGHGENTVIQDGISEEIDFVDAT